MIIDLDRGTDGKRRQKWSSTGTSIRRDAEKELRKRLGLVDQGHDPFPVEAITVAQLVERWSAHMDAVDHPRPKGRREFRRYAKLLVERLGPVRIDRARRVDLQELVDGETARGLAPASVAQVKAAISSVFAFAVRVDLLPQNPARGVQVPTKQKPKLITPTPAQLLQLGDAAEDTTWAIPTRVAVATGARRGEVLGLRWSHVDLDRGRIRIDETLQRVDGELRFVPPKTERARREIPLPEFAVERLRRHKVEQAARRLRLGEAWHDIDLVCERGDGAPLDPDSFSHAFKRIAASIGLDGVRLHDCRHGVITAMAAQRVPAYVTSAIAGHSSVHFTATVYTHVDDEQIDRALAGLEEAFGT
jgi:integrase